MATMQFTIWFLIPFLSLAEGSKILIIGGITARSHYNVLTPIIEELANRKHDITVQGYFTRDEPLPNVRELMITPADYMQDPEVGKRLFFKTLTLGPIGEMQNYEPFTRPFCETYINDASTKTLLAEGMQYDLVIIDALFPECHMAVASLIAKHMMDLYTTAWFPWRQTPAPIPPSYVPSNLLTFPSKMTFFERLENAISLFGVRYAYRHTLNPGFQEMISKFLPQAGTIEELEKKIVFSLTNGDPVMNSPRPSVPNVIHCGGMQCKKAKPLPKELNDFVESSGKDGFIVFGLGSNMKSEYLPQEYIQAILSTFSRLKQKVIWKFEAKLDNVPENVKIVNWMPQQDLLGHPKIRLFITHAGLLSLQEAIYHAVPVIGVPFFSDQDGNSARIIELGIGERLDFFDITSNNLFKLIEKVLNGKSYYANMKKYSDIFKDEPEKAVDRAVFWIEYVIRHEGARHFRSAGEDLNFFQYFLLDVAAFLLGAGAIVIGILVYIVKFALGALCRRKESNREKLKRK